MYDGIRYSVYIIVRVEFSCFEQLLYFRELFPVFCAEFFFENIEK